MRTTDSALLHFDGLPPVQPGQLRGFWRGATWPTGHPLDGVLEACGWAGKRFDDDEAVHPLVFRSAAGRLLQVRPLGARPAVALLCRLPLLRRPPATTVVRALLPLLATGQPQARLRTVMHRGVASAAIVYDTVPVIDHLRRLDARRVLGLMDLRGLGQPFFFVLEGG